MVNADGNVSYSIWVWLLQSQQKIIMTGVVIDPSSMIDPHPFSPIKQ